jgi:hypothetical protein
LPVATTARDAGRLWSCPPLSAAAQKQEAAFKKQIDQLTSNVQLISKASDDKLTDLKDRIVAMESRSSGCVRRSIEKRNRLLRERGIDRGFAITPRST